MNYQKQSEAPGEQMTLFSLGASRNLASHSVKQETEKAQTITAISGRSIYEQYGKYSPLPWLVKTLLESSRWRNERCSLEWTVEGVSDLTTTTSTRLYTHDKLKCLSQVSSKILKKKVTKSKHLIFRLRVSVLHTEGKGSGLLPTVTTDSVSNRKGKYKQGGTPLTLAVSQMLPTPTSTDSQDRPLRQMTIDNMKQGKKKGANLQHIVKEPELQKLYGMLLTPTTRDYKGSRTKEKLKEKGRNHTNSLPDAFAQPGKTSQLNPLFVAEMMGFPTDWTVLPFLAGETNQSKDLVTQ